VRLTSLRFLSLARRYDFQSRSVFGMYLDVPVDVLPTNGINVVMSTEETAKQLNPLFRPTQCDLRTSGAALYGL
jgi:hypothetical protein